MTNPRDNDEAKQSGNQGCFLSYIQRPNPCSANPSGVPSDITDTINGNNNTTVSQIRKAYNVSSKYGSLVFALKINRTNNPNGSFTDNFSIKFKKLYSVPATKDLTIDDIFSEPQGKSIGRIEYAVLDASKMDSAGERFLTKDVKRKIHYMPHASQLVDVWCNMFETVLQYENKNIPVSVHGVGDYFNRIFLSFSGESEDRHIKKLRHFKIRPAYITEGRDFEELKSLFIALKKYLNSMPDEQQKNIAVCFALPEHHFEYV